MAILKGNSNRTFVWCLLLICCFRADYASAQYQLTWSTIDGGGGRSTGETYTLEGTIGQPDAGFMSGGDYVLAGGFWPATNWCIVDLPDLANFTTQWLLNSGAPLADFNSNGRVDLHDYNHLANYWLRLCPNNWPWW